MERLIAKLTDLITAEVLGCSPERANTHSRTLHGARQHPTSRCQRALEMILYTEYTVYLIAR
eukprot:6187451-Amphidinium_carterae.4